MTEVNENLTIEDWGWLDTVQVSLDVPRPIPNRKPQDSLLVDARLSPATQKLEQRRLDREARKRAGRKKRKRYTRKRGTVHPKKKEATRRRLLKRQWALRPYSCVVRGYGSYQLPKEDWDRLIAPLWEVYLPEDLKVKRYRGYGTRDKPITVYSLDVVHSTLGVVYNGNSQQLFDLSRPSPLM